MHYATGNTCSTSDINSSIELWKNKCHSDLPLSIKWKEYDFDKFFVQNQLKDSARNENKSMTLTDRSELYLVLKYQPIERFIS